MDNEKDLLNSIENSEDNLSVPQNRKKKLSSKKLILIILALLMILLIIIIVVASLNHECKHKHTSVLKAVTATCTDSGLTEGKMCDDCGEVIKEQKTIETLEHSFDEGVVKKEQTCTEEGILEFSCEACEYTKTEKIELHHYLEPEHEKRATCREEGIDKYACADCGYIKTETVEKIEHDWESVGGSSYSETCRNCKSLKLSSLDIKADEWITAKRTGDYLQYKNAFVTYQGLAYDGVYVNITPICHICRISNTSETLFNQNVSATNAFFKTYICNECGAETECEAKLVY